MKHRTLSSRGRSRRAMSYARGCALALLVLVLGSGCETIVIDRTPPCPMPTSEAIEQTAPLDGTALGWYIGEIERFCDALGARW